MATGISVCNGSLLVGALADTSLNHFIPGHFEKASPLITGLTSISMGIHFVDKLHNLPPVVLVVIVGTIIGGLLNIGKWIERVGTTLRTPIERIFPAQANASVSAEDFMNQFVAMLTLFYANGTGIFGVLTEGMVSDPTILLIKSILDFFTVTIFTSMLGYIITVVFIPQLIVFIILFFTATFIMTLISPAMIVDFAACGGIIMLAAGFRLCRTRTFPTANVLPSLLLVIPFSAAWQQFVA